jgi:uncharacterized metal-binding protein
MEETGYGKLYNDADREVMKVAEDSLNPRDDRVTEIITFAKEAGINKIGIANCIAFEKEGKKLETILKENGFEIARANCKLGKVPRNEIVPEYKGVSCNPAGQAQVMEDNGTELNIVMGLCVGHDMVFNSKSKVLTTNLIVKDRKLKHNPLLYFKK